MSLLQLNPQIPVFVEDKGNGRAIGWLDYSAEDHLLWIVAMDGTGEIWVVPSPKIRLQWNYSIGRINPSHDSEMKVNDDFQKG